MIGSSPRPWGTLVRNFIAVDIDRFIPTPVGNAAAKHKAVDVGAVHPHARGERARLFLAEILLGGSSPRPWGTLQYLKFMPARLRFIPTPVGNASNLRVIFWG